MVIVMYEELRGINMGTKRYYYHNYNAKLFSSLSCHRNTREHVGNILVLPVVLFHQVVMVIRYFTLLG